MVYKKIKIENFRCFKEIELNNLNRINLILGENNIGKTALLEAIFIMSGTHPELMIRTDRFRGLPLFPIDISGSESLESPVNGFFHNFNIAQDIELFSERVSGETQNIRIKASPPSTILLSSAEGEEKLAITGGYSYELCSFEYKDSKGKKFISKLIFTEQGKGIQLKIEPPPPRPDFITIFVYPTQLPFQSDVVERIGKILRRVNEKRRIIEVLKIIEPRLRDILIIPIGKVPIIHVDIGFDKALPLPLAGLGMVRLLRYISDIMSVPGGVVLIDEVENGLHYSKLTNIWKVIGRLAKDYDVQIFATTHSLECVIYAYNNFVKDTPYNLGVFRIERDKDGNLEVVEYDKETLSISIENKLELR
ncbi:MAG: hypothetical protein DRP84_11865 [Spirochaetes bacterium]|nr:MAG: hypothetical protein DRP84_11865 [Spirochaetota bacterium]RKY36208.1 MAG: hypothetical protein DRP72_04355 [Candidatus Omnitrophota bacterium]